MSENPFYRLAPFIQEFIYRNNWTELRQVQVEACRVVFETDEHLLLATGTASGKTEAAFLPILTLLHEKPSKSLGALYIGPLKALINDQFARLNDLLKEADIPVWHWHGDVSQVEKQRLLRNPQGILQITPESLESFLINRSTSLAQMVADLQFIVIDEVHAFMSSDRGLQVLCQLQRLSRYMQQQPRRIGLSATLGDHSLAEVWLKSGTDRSVITPRVSAGKQRIRLAVEHFLMPPEEQHQPDEASEHEEHGLPSDRYIYDLTRGKKALIFANSRAETESVVAALRQIADDEHSPDIYHVHHGSISAALREAAEQAMRDPVQPAVTAATVTLELGIDIGQLERIVQLEAPFSIASFLQRLGRSGRRGQPSEMWCVCREEQASGKEDLPEQLPWSLLQAIAIIQLYLEEKWIEPQRAIKLPVSLLYHQTMSTLLAAGELSPAALAQRVLSLAPFASVTQETYKDLLRHLLSLGHIQRTEEGGLIVGLSGERITSNYHFYAVFRENPEFTVYAEDKQVGTIVSPPPPGERFALAGRTWEVLETDSKRRVVIAKQVKGRVRAHWNGGGGDIHTRILRRMRQVLLEDTVYEYLQPGARERIAAGRKLAGALNIKDKLLFSLSDTRHCILPWLGTISFRTLTRFLEIANRQALPMSGFSGLPPYYLVISTSEPVSASAIESAIFAAIQAKFDPEDLVKTNEAPALEKYDEYVPASLLRQAFVADRINVENMLRELSSLLPQRTSALET
jgi:ATP-dependent helicase Lhr and Lhr-like helicase